MGVNFSAGTNFFVISLIGVSTGPGATALMSIDSSLRSLKDVERTRPISYVEMDSAGTASKTGRKN